MNKLKVQTCSSEAGESRGWVHSVKSIQPDTAGCPFLNVFDSVDSLGSRHPACRKAGPHTRRQRKSVSEPESGLLSKCVCHLPLTGNQGDRGDKGPAGEGLDGPDGDQGLQGMRPLSPTLHRHLWVPSMSPLLRELFS